LKLRGVAPGAAIIETYVVYTTRIPPEMSRIFNFLPVNFITFSWVIDNMASPITFPGLEQMEDEKQLTG